MADPEDLFASALRFHEAGNSAQAESLYRQIILRDPADCRVLNRLGILLYQSARPDQAVACFQEAIRVNAHDFQAYANLGKVLQDDGQLGPAIDCYRQALRWQPEQLGVLVNLGSALNKQGQVIEAEACYHHVLRINPAHADALYNLGNLLFQQKRFTDAAACYQEILRFNPTSAIAQHALGNVFFEEDRLEAAIQCYHLVLQINPGQLHARMNLANACYFLGEPAQAEYHYRLVLEVMPDDPDVLVNLGNALRNQNLLAAAAQCFATALSASPHHAKAMWSRGELRLLQGDFAGGWPDHEWRWREQGSAAEAFSQPRWDGQPLEGRTILVRAEGGLGDTLQFIRYLPLVQNRGGRVLFECQPPLCSLLADIPGVDMLVSSGALLPPFDVYIPLLSLPGLFGTTLATIPAVGPLLRVNPNLVERWRQALGSDFRENGELKIGFAWQSDTRLKEYRLRSCPLASFGTLADVEGVHLFSLQFGPATKELASASFAVTDLGSRFDPKTLDDLAATVLNLDLIVTVDTAVAHLAGLLGRQVWVVLPYAADWRWFLERSDSPWYPTVRLFRQTKIGGWTEVFERVTAEVRLALSHSRGA